MARSRAEYEVLPLREELESLVHSYYHLRNEHKQAGPESSMRRRIEDSMLAVRERFERVLSEWLPDEELQEEWRAHLENRGPAPAEPVVIQPVVFRGVSDAGSVVEIRRRSGEELEVRVDGALIERIEGEKDFQVTGPSGSGWTTSRSGRRLPPRPKLSRRSPTTSTVRVILRGSMRRSCSPTG